MLKHLYLTLGFHRMTLRFQHRGSKWPSVFSDARNTDWACHTHPKTASLKPSVPDAMSQQAEEVDVWRLSGHPCLCQNCMFKKGIPQKICKRILAKSSLTWTPHPSPNDPIGKGIELKYKLAELSTVLTAKKYARLLTAHVCTNKYGNPFNIFRKVCTQVQDGSYS